MDPAGTGPRRAVAVPGRHDIAEAAPDLPGDPDQVRRLPVGWLVLQGPDVLAQIARELVAVMQRDIKTDWTVRDDVRAKLRSSIKRLLVKYNYPPDKQPGAIKLVIEQMQAMAPRFVPSTHTPGQ
jgi:hypothetical protein